MQILYWDTNQFLPLNMINTQQDDYKSEQTMDGSLDCKCYIKMCKCSIHPRGKDEWIASMRDSLARTFQSPVMARALQEAEAVSGAKLSGSLASYECQNSSWRTAQLSLLEDSALLSEIWPSWGMTQGMESYQLPQLVHRTYVLDGGAWRAEGCMMPTPTACEAPNKKANTNGPKRIADVARGEWDHLWQTPVADDAVSRRKGKFNSRGEPKLSAQVMFPTPSAQEAGVITRDQIEGEPEQGKRIYSKKTGNHMQVTLNRHVSLWPTATASAYKGSSPATLTRKNGKSRERDRLDHAVMAANGGQLNPEWVEWLMGWPIGATE